MHGVSDRNSLSLLPLLEFLMPEMKGFQIQATFWGFYNSRILVSFWWNSSDSYYSILKVGDDVICQGLFLCRNFWNSCLLEFTKFEMPVNSVIPEFLVLFMSKFLLENFMHHEFHKFLILQLLEFFCGILQNGHTYTIL